jgi:hypothetical protein
MSRIEVLSGPERRRRWSAEQKRSIVAEAFFAGGVGMRGRPAQGCRGRADLSVAARASSCGGGIRRSGGSAGAEQGILLGRGPAFAHRRQPIRSASRESG